MIEYPVFIFLGIQTKMRTSKFTTLDLRKLLEHIRNMEEDNGE